MDNINVNRQPEGIPAGGQFKETTHPQAGFTLPAPITGTGSYETGRLVLWNDEDGTEHPGKVLNAGGSEITVALEDGREFTAYQDSEELRVDPERETEAVINRVINGSRTFNLIHVDQGDRLQDSEIEDYLEGNYERVEIDVLEKLEEYNTESASEEARDLLKESGLDADDVDTDKFDDLAEAIRDKDASDPMPQLLRNTPEKLMRLTLEQPAGDGLYDGNKDGVDEAREAKIAKILGAKGLDVTTAEAKEAIGELVAEGPQYWHEGVDLDVIYFDDIQGSTIYNKEDGLVAPRDLTFQNPHIVLIDRVNGSGHDVQFTGAVTAAATEENPVKLDASTMHGYGWDETAGVVHSAYRTETSGTWVDPEPESAAA